MSEDADPVDQEPEEAMGLALSPPIKAPPRKRSLTKLSRELSDKEATSPAVTKLLIDDIERLESEISDLKQFQTQFHEADKKASILQQKLLSVTSMEVIHAGCIAIGGALLGYAGSSQSNWFAGVCGGVLVGAGIWAKKIKL
jgi:hypothetical protein